VDRRHAICGSVSDILSNPLNRGRTIADYGPQLQGRQKHERGLRCLLSLNEFYHV
jgi:hypothetical protein